MANVNITNAIKSSEARASIDAKYGPYASVAAAHAALGEEGADVAAVGLTVGIMDGGSVVEYWYQGGTTQAHLVPKQAGGSAPSLTEVQHSGATPGTVTVKGGEYHTFSDAVDSLTIAFGTPAPNPFAESQLEFSTSANFAGVTWPSGCKFANQQPMLVASSMYLVSVLHGIVAVTEVVAS